MAGPGQPGRRKRGPKSELERIDLYTSIIAMVEDDCSAHEIARRTGYSIRRTYDLVKQATAFYADRRLASIGAKGMRHDMRVQAGIDGYLDSATDDTGTLVIQPKDLPGFASWQTYIAKRTGQLQPTGASTVNVQVNTEGGDAQVNIATDLVNRTARVMAGLDAINLDNVGSGRSPEEQLATLAEIGPVLDAEIVDAELVEDDDDALYDAEYDDDSSPDDDAGEIPGRWHNGKHIPFWAESAWLWQGEDDPTHHEPGYNADVHD